MNAFVVQYRGECPPPTEDATAFFEIAPEYLRESNAVLIGLETRLKKLREDPATERLENREQVLRQMKKQNAEIRKAATHEAERVLLLRSCLEELIQTGSPIKGVQ